MPKSEISIVFAALSGADPAEAVSPALPRTLQLLAERDLPASFVINEDLAEDEPFAVTMIENARHAVLRVAPKSSAHATVDSSPGEWHVAMQKAVGKAVSSGDGTTLSFDLAAVERGDGANLLAETLDLIAGLRRAGSINVAEAESQP